MLLNGSFNVSQVKTADVDGATLAFEASSLTSRLQEAWEPVKGLLARQCRYYGPTIG